MFYIFLIFALGLTSCYILLIGCIYNGKEELYIAQHDWIDAIIYLLIGFLLGSLIIDHSERFLLLGFYIR
jgi:hypothetical protein